MNKIFVPNSITFVGGSLKEIANTLKTLEVENPLIITDNNMVKLEIINPLKRYLTDNKISYDIFKDTIPEPTSASILEPVQILKEGKFDQYYSLWRR